MVGNTIESTGSGLALVAAEAMQRGDRTALDLIDGAFGWQPLFVAVMDLASHVVSTADRDRAPMMLRSTRPYMDALVRSRAAFAGANVESASFYAAAFFDGPVMQLAVHGACADRFDLDTGSDDDCRTATVALATVALHLIGFEVSVRIESEGIDLSVDDVITAHRARTLIEAAAN